MCLCYITFGYGAVGKFLIVGMCYDLVLGEAFPGLNLGEGEGCTREAYLGHRDAGCDHTECNSCQPSRAVNSRERVWGTADSTGSRNSRATRGRLGGSRGVGREGRVEKGGSSLSESRMRLQSSLISVHANAWPNS